MWGSWQTGAHPAHLKLLASSDTAAPPHWWKQKWWREWQKKLACRGTLWTVPRWPRGRWLRWTRPHRCPGRRSPRCCLWRYLWTHPHTGPGWLPLCLQTCLRRKKKKTMNSQPLTEVCGGWEASAGYSGIKPSVETPRPGQSFVFSSPACVVRTRGSLGNRTRGLGGGWVIGDFGQALFPPQIPQFFVDGNNSMRVVNFRGEDTGFREDK